MTALLKWLERRSAPAAECWESWIEVDNPCPPPIPAGPLQVVQYIGALFCGGAERQLCNLASGLKQQGHRVQVRTTYGLDGDLGHYCGLLAESGIPARPALAPRMLPWRRPIDPRRLALVPLPIRDYVYQLAAELAADTPHVLHGWLDLANVIGGLAGLLAGVPRIVLGLRTSNPTHFPRFHHDFMRPCYRWLIRSRRVKLLANSRSAAASYAEWLDLSPERVAVVVNGLSPDQFPQADVSERQAARQALGLLPSHRVVCGLFRLFEEKQPELFLRVARQAAGRVAGLRVLIAGIGPLEGVMRAYLAEHGMEYVQLLGRRDDVRQVLLASDVLLLTSAQDSSPNAIIEAQHLNVPVVATDVGGISEIVRPGETGLLAGKHDADGLADHVVGLLEDEAKRKTLSRAARSLAKETFDLERMIAQTLAIYRHQ